MLVTLCAGFLSRLDDVVSTLVLEVDAEVDAHGLFPNNSSIT